MILIVRLNATGHQPNELGESLGAVLAGAQLMAMATVTDSGSPHVNTVFFAESTDLRLLFVSERLSKHCQFLKANPSTAASVWLDPPEYGEQLRGAQLFGTVTELSGNQAVGAFDRYREKFPAFRGDTQMRDLLVRADGTVAIYQIMVDRVTLLDEPRFGRRNYIDLAVSR